MPNIIPILRLRNNTKDIKEAEYTLAEIDEVNRMSEVCTLASDLKKAEDRANREGWIEADDFDREMGIIE